VIRSWADARGELALKEAAVAIVGLAEVFPSFIGNSIHPRCLL
jgi:hypothetical protein